MRRQLEDALAGHGLHEIVGWSFTEPAVLERLRIPAGDPLAEVVALRNPLSESQSILRPTLLCSLLDAAAHNIARDGPDLEIFESGTVYRAAEGGLAHEHHAVGGLLDRRDAAPRMARRADRARLLHRQGTR